ncbi:MAG: glycosyltransferase, partial [Haloarculaceae archaeon]
RRPAIDFPCGESIETFSPVPGEGSYMPTALLVSNRRPDEPGGRPEKIATRIRLFDDRGWDVRILYVGPPYGRSFLPGIVRGISAAREPSVVLSINNPFHLHLVGAAIRLTVGTPWVAELRDPIVNHPDRNEGGIPFYLASIVERIVVRYADRVVWLDGIQLPDDYFERNYPDAAHEHFHKLPFMGFERKRFDDITVEDRDLFTIVYAGSFYEGWIEPIEFLEGLALYVEGSATGEPPSIRVDFYGDWSEKYDSVVERLGIEDVVETHGFVDHDDVIAALKGSDFALYIGGNDPRNRLNVPSKIWDYLGSRTPILAIVDADFRAAEFLDEHGFGLVVPPGDSESVAEAIEAVRSGEFHFNTDPGAVDQFSRERHVAAYTDYLEQTLETIGSGTE